MSTELIGNWGWSLVADAGLQALYAALVAAAVGGICKLLPRAHPALRSALWSLVFVRLVLPVDFGLPFSLRQLAARWWPQVEPLAGFGAAEHGPAASTVLAGSESAVVSTAGGSLLALWPLALLATWLAGACLFALGRAGRRRRFRRMVRTAPEVTSPRLVAVVERWRRRFGVRRRVRLVAVAERVPPFTLGLVRPAIALPLALVARGEAATLDAVIGHEMAHVARWDDLRLRATEWLLAAWFFHPAAWLAATKLAEERERRADEAVLGDGALSARAYATALLAVLRLELPTPGADRVSRSVPAFTHPKRRIALRIQTILAARHRRRPLTTALVTLAAAALLLPLAPAGSAPAADAQVAMDAALPSGIATPQAAEAAPPRLANPLPDRRVTSAFGPREDPFGEGKHHDGVDVHAESGDLVRAARDGRVTVATESYAGGERYGTVVLVDHGDGLETFYAHLESLRVEPGQEVKGGAPLGVAGNSGQTTGPHLHFEVWVHGEPVDPGELVEGW